MAGPSPSSQPAPLLSGMPRGGQGGQSIGDLQPAAARMQRTDAQPLGSALPRASGHGGAAALGTSNASQPSSLNWFRGDSIRGVDREFIYQVGWGSLCTGVGQTQLREALSALAQASDLTRTGAGSLPVDFRVVVEQCMWLGPVLC